MLVDLLGVIALKCPEIVTVVMTQRKKTLELDDLSKLPVYEPGLADIIKNTRNKIYFFLMI